MVDLEDILFFPSVFENLVSVNGIKRSQVCWIYITKTSWCFVMPLFMIPTLHSPLIGVPPGATKISRMF